LTTVFDSQAVTSAETLTLKAVQHIMNTHHELVRSLNALLFSLDLPFELRAATELTPLLLLAILECLMGARLPLPGGRDEVDKVQAMKVFLGVLEHDVVKADVGLSEVDPRTLARGGEEECVLVGEVLCWVGRRVEREKRRQRRSGSSFGSGGSGGSLKNGEERSILRPTRTNSPSLMTQPIASEGVLEKPSFTRSPPQPHNDENGGDFDDSAIADAETSVSGSSTPTITTFALGVTSHATPPRSRVFMRQEQVQTQLFPAGPRCIHELLDSEAEFDFEAGPEDEDDAVSLVSYGSCDLVRSVGARSESVVSSCCHCHHTDSEADCQGSYDEDLTTSSYCHCRCDSDSDAGSAPFLNISRTGRAGRYVDDDDIDSVVNKDVNPDLDFREISISDPSFFETGGNRGMSGRKSGITMLSPSSTPSLSPFPTPTPTRTPLPQTSFTSTRTPLASTWIPITPLPSSSIPSMDVRRALVTKPTTTPSERLRA
jgi:hypothetical protein